jgi:hypothetical protein
MGRTTGTSEVARYRSISMSGRGTVHIGVGHQLARLTPAAATEPLLRGLAYPANQFVAGDGGRGGGP